MRNSVNEEISEEENQNVLLKAILKAKNKEKKKIQRKKWQNTFKGRRICIFEDKIDTELKQISYEKE